MKNLYSIVSFSLFLGVLFSACEKKDDMIKPVCKITSPQNGTKFIAGDTVTILVASEDDGLITEIRLQGIDLSSTNINEKVITREFYWITEESDIGDHYITATALDNDGLYSEDSVLIKIIEDTAVVADFIIDNPTQIKGGSVTFSDASKNNITSWLWDFGDGGTSNEQNPSHTYTSVGTYTISLVIENNFGTDTCFKYNSVIITNEDGTQSNLTDDEGNVYPIIKIGDQWWMGENLHATKYNDGNLINNRNDPSLWASFNYGAYMLRNITGTPGAPFTWYTSDEVFYYNWYCVKSGKLSPKGWHIPDDTEWQVMVDYLGGESIAGGKLKYADTLRWNSPNIGGTNETGFSAIPADHINSLTGYFMNTGTTAGFWSATLNDFQRPSSWNIYNTGPEVTLFKSNHIEDGYPVRCIRD